MVRCEAVFPTKDEMLEKIHSRNIPVNQISSPIQTSLLEKSYPVDGASVGLRVGESVGGAVVHVGLAVGEVVSIRPSVGEAVGSFVGY